MRFLMMMNVFMLCFSSVSILMAEDPPSKDYPDLGFRTVTVLDYKKALREEGEDVPQFPPRTSSALIIRSVKPDSPAANAGLKDQDLVRIINGQYLRSLTAGEKILNTASRQEPLKLGVVRRGKASWDQISIEIQPLSETQALKRNFLKTAGFDERYESCFKVRHKDAPSTLFVPDQFQLYYAEKRLHPDRLYLQVAMKIPENTQPGPLVISTDSNRYRLEQPPLYLRRYLNPQREEMKKLDQAQKKNDRLLAEIRKSHQKTKEEFNRVDKVYQEKYKKFDFAESLKDKAARDKQKEKIKILKSLEELNGTLIKLDKATLNFLEVTKSLATRQKDLASQIIQMAEDVKVKRNARYSALTSEQKLLLQAVGSGKKEVGHLTEADLLKLEETGFGGDWIQTQRASQGWKWFDALLNNEQQLKMIKDIISSDRVTVHHESHPQQKFTVTPEQKEQMKAVLTVFEAEGGKVED